MQGAKGLNCLVANGTRMATKTPILVPVEGYNTYPTIPSVRKVEVNEGLIRRVNMGHL